MFQINIILISSSKYHTFFFFPATLGEVVFAGAYEKQNQDSVISRVLINSTTGKIDLDSAIKTEKDSTSWLNSKYLAS